MLKEKSITKEKSISECKKLWEEIEKSGLPKLEFLQTKEGLLWQRKDYWANCPLCQYAASHRKELSTSLSFCLICPLVTKYGKKCSGLGFDVDTHEATKEFFAAVRGL